MAKKKKRTFLMVLLLYYHIECINTELSLAENGMSYATILLMKIMAANNFQVVLCGLTPCDLLRKEREKIPGFS